MIHHLKKERISSVLPPCNPKTKYGLKLSSEEESIMLSGANCRLEHLHVGEKSHFERTVGELGSK